MNKTGQKVMLQYPNGDVVKTVRRKVTNVKCQATSVI